MLPNFPVLANFTFPELLLVTVGGAIGALIEDCSGDGYLTMPRIKDGKMYVGFLGGMLVGALAGLIVDGSFATAIIGGYAGTSIITRLLDNGTHI